MFLIIPCATLIFVGVTAAETGDTRGSRAGFRAHRL